MDFLSAHEYGVSFALGVAAIGHFAFKQLNEPFADDTTQLLPEDLRMSPSVVTSRSLFVEAYIYYVSILLVSYFVLCFSEPVYNLVFGADRVGPSGGTAFNPQSGTWPLTVALLIVGLSPNFPVLRDAELLFRKFSRRSAGIPRNFVETLSRVKRLKLESREGEKSYARDIEEVVSILSVYWAMSGIPRPAHSTLTRNVRRGLRLYNWTLSPDSSVTWSSQALGKISLSDENGVISRLREARDTVLKILSDPDADKFHNLIEETVKADFTYDDRERRELVEYWNANKDKLVPSLEDASEAARTFAEYIRRLETTFSLLVTHDNSTRNIKDPVLKRILKHLHSFQSSYTRNLILSAAVTAAAVSFTLATAILLAKSVHCDDTRLGPALADSIGYSVSYVLSFFISITTGVLGALFYYKVKDVEERGGPLEESIFPIGYYIGLFVMAFIFAGIGTSMLWIIYNYPASVSLDAFYRDFVAAIGRTLIEAIPGAVFGTIFVILLEKCSGGAGTPLHQYSKWRLGAYAVLVGFFAVVPTFIGYHMIFSQLHGEILELCARNSKLIQILLAALTPMIVLGILSQQMCMVSRLREEPQA